jgi:NADPH2:quinone reductase
MSEAIVMTEAGGPEVLKLVTRATPTPGPGEILVRVEAVGVNFIDIYRRQGVYVMPLPHTPGEECAGVIEAVGEGVNGLQVGDRVVSAQAAGSYAQHVVYKASGAVRIPDDVTFEQAAGVFLQGLTAHYLCTSVFDVQPGHTVLIHAGAGGVGLLLTQLCKSRGATVITTTSTDEKAELSRGAGADYVLGYTGFGEKVREITGGLGVDVAFDGVGKDTFDESLTSIRRRGTMACFGAASGLVPPVDIMKLHKNGSLMLTRPNLWDFIATPEDLQWRSGELLGAVGAGKLDVRIGARYPLAEAGAAQEALLGRGTTGKVLLLP